MKALHLWYGHLRDANLETVGPTNLATGKPTSKKPGFLEVMKITGMSRITSGCFSILSLPGPLRKNDDLT